MAYEKTIKLFIITMSVLLLCAQFTSQKTSTDGREKPSLNVYGILTDTTNHTCNIENITIAGRFNDIAVYQKPLSPDVNPDINTTKINLCDISEIIVGPAKVEQFNKRDYIEITIISNDKRKTKNVYIIEKLKKLFCDEVNEAGPIEKELSLLAIKRLQINGCKKQEDQKCTPRQCSYTIDQQMLDIHLTTTQKLINEIKTTAEELPEETSLKNQILQLLDDLKTSFKNWLT